MTMPVCGVARELETVGLRLNKKPPNIYFRKKVGARRSAASAIG